MANRHTPNSRPREDTKIAFNLFKFHDALDCALRCSVKVVQCEDVKGARSRLSATSIRFKLLRALVLHLRRICTHSSDRHCNRFLARYLASNFCVVMECYGSLFSLREASPLEFFDCHSAPFSSEEVSETQRGSMTMGKMRRYHPRLMM